MPVQVEKVAKTRELVLAELPEIKKALAHFDAATTVDNIEKYITNENLSKIFESFGIPSPTSGLSISTLPEEYKALQIETVVKQVNYGFTIAMGGLLPTLTEILNEIGIKAIKNNSLEGGSLAESFTGAKFLFKSS